MKTLSSRHFLALFGALFIFAMTHTSDANAEWKICWEMTIDGETNTVCESAAALKAECPLTDPENVTEVCQTATANRPDPSEGSPGNLSLGQNGDQSRNN